MSLREKCHHQEKMGTRGSGQRPVPGGREGRHRTDGHAGASLVASWPDMICEMMAQPTNCRLRRFTSCQTPDANRRRLGLRGSVSVAPEYYRLYAPKALPWYVCEQHTSITTSNTCCVLHDTAGNNAWPHPSCLLRVHHAPAPTLGPHRPGFCLWPGLHGRASALAFVPGPDQAPKHALNQQALPVRMSESSYEYCPYSMQPAMQAHALAAREASGTLCGPRVHRCLVCLWLFPSLTRPLSHTHTWPCSMHIRGTATGTLSRLSVSRPTPPKPTDKVTSCLSGENMTPPFRDDGSFIPLPWGTHA